MLFSHKRPSRVDLSKDSLPLLFSAASGIFIKKRRVKKAAVNVERSMAITASMPAREKTAVAITGVRIELSDCEKERILLVF